MKRLAIDLGTANTLVFMEGRGVVFNEPTIISYSTLDKKIIAIGNDAKSMAGKTPEGIVVKRPMRKGVIASFKLTEMLLRILFRKVLGKSFMCRQPEVMISVPAGLTSVEERAVIEAGVSAGASKIYLIPEPIAAAIGAGIPVSSAEGDIIVNMGGGTAEIAVISLNGLVRYRSKRVSGDSINESIQMHLKKKYKLLIGEQMAEDIKLTIGSVMKLRDPISMDVRGTDAISNLPKTLRLDSNDVVQPIKQVLLQIIDSVKDVLEDTPPELVADIIDKGIVLSGGTANIRNIEVFFTQNLHVPVHIVEDPLKRVVEGISRALVDIDVFRRTLKG